MRIVAADLEPILDGDDGGEDVDVGADDGGSGRRRGAPRHRRRRRLAGAGPWVLTVALAVIVVGLGVDDARQRRRLDEAGGRAAVAAKAKATAAEEDADQHRRLAEAQRLLEIGRRKDEERRQAIAYATSGMAANGRRDPITERRSSPWCRAKDLRVTPVGFVSRTGRRCSLADHPVLLRRIGDGPWQEVPVFPSTQRSYSDGPAWDGELDPRYTAVLALWRQVIDPAIGVCLTGPADIEGGLDRLGIRLQPDDDVLELPGRQLLPSPCRPAMGVWAYDSTDA